MSYCYCRFVWKNKVLGIYFPEGILNFLYFESEQVISLKWLELDQRLFPCREIGETNCYFTSELGIMMAPTIERTFFIINLKECKVTRILDLEIPYDDWLFLFNCSKVFQKLTVTCYIPRARYSKPHVMVKKKKICIGFWFMWCIIATQKTCHRLDKKTLQN